MKAYWTFLLVVTLQSQYYVTNKYAVLIDQSIDKYVELCDKVEQKHICKPSFAYIRFLTFNNPCIVRCYNEIIKKQSVKPLTHLWRAYKEETIDCQKNKFLYEFCHLIFIVFEQFLIHLASELTGESQSSLQELFERVEAMIPIDDLIEILETCYAKLKEVITQVETTPPQWQGKISKRWIMLAITVIVVAKKLYHYFYNKKSVVQPSVVQPKVLLDIH